MRNKGRSVGRAELRQGQEARTSQDAMQWEMQAWAGHGLEGCLDDLRGRVQKAPEVGDGRAGGNNKDSR